MPHRRHSKVVIIGGGQAGGRLAQLLAADADRFEVILVGREPHPPYERPPLSKGALLGTASLQSCLLWPEMDQAWTRVERRVGVAADSIERETKAVRLSNGERLHYDFLALATGSTARRLVCPGSDLDGICHLRSIEDSLAIGEHFAEGKRLIVVGGGFIGMEVAASARSRQLDVTVVEASDRVLARVVPAEIARLVAQRHESEGVVVKLRTMVERFIGNGKGVVKAVELSSGQILPCDLAVVGIGASPDTDLAAASGLEMEVGVRVDSSLRTSDPTIFACGDIATFWHPLFEQHVRIEAWQNAEDHARVVASAIRGEASTSESVPWFWSDQHQLSLQITGLPYLGSSAVKRSMDDGAVVLFHLDPTGRLVAATGLGKVEAIGREIRAAQALIAARSAPSPALLRDPRARLKSLLRKPLATGPGLLFPQPIVG